MNIYHLCLYNLLVLSKFESVRCVLFLHLFHFIINTPMAKDSVSVLTVISRKSHQVKSVISKRIGCFQKIKMKKFLVIFFAYRSFSMFIVILRILIHTGLIFLGSSCRDFQYRGGATSWWLQFRLQYRLFG